MFGLYRKLHLFSINGEKIEKNGTFFYLLQLSESRETLNLWVLLIMDSEEVL